MQFTRLGNFGVQNTYFQIKTRIYVYVGIDVNGEVKQIFFIFFFLLLLFIFFFYFFIIIIIFFIYFFYFYFIFFFFLGGGGGVRRDVQGEVKFFENSNYKFYGGGDGGWGWGDRVGGVRVDVNVNVIFFWKGVGSRVGVALGVGLGCQGRCERRSGVLVRIQKQNGGWQGVGFGGVSVDVNEELKFL